MTTVKMSSMNNWLGILLLSMLHLVDAENLTDWNTGDGGFKWRANCDFPGDDIGQVLLTTATREECGRLCIANPQCSHFVFGYLEKCYMKNTPSTTHRQDIDYESTAICGFIPWRFESQIGRDDWKSTSESGAHSCSFYGNDSLILTTDCRQAEDCSLWYDQVLPTNGSTACKLLDGNSGSCCPVLPKITIKFHEETQYIKMIPDERERIIDAGTNLTLTCVYAFEDEYQKKNYNFSWEIPDYLIKNTELSDLDSRLRKTFGRNETHMTSTLSLVNARARDTGNFGCKGIPYGIANTFTVSQYVYVFNDSELVIIEGNEFYFEISQDQTNFPVKCIPTHPDVKVSLIHRHQYTARGQNWLEPKADLLEELCSTWCFNKKSGLNLKKAKIDDSGHFECIGTYKNKTNLHNFYLFVSGMELKGVDGAGDPYFEGIDVTLICRTYQYTKFSSPPNWSYRINGKEQIHIIDENNSPEGIEIRKDSFDYSGKTLYENQLHIFDISPKGYSFQCQGSGFIDYVWKTFLAKELHGDLKHKSVQLEKDIAQNLTCFLGSQNASTKWLKDEKEYSEQVYSVGNSSILPLYGKMGESGSYACQWKVSFPGDAKYRNFTVSFLDKIPVNDKTVTIAVPTIFAILLFILIVSVGVKFYYDKKRRVSQEAFVRLLNGNAKQINNQSPIEEQVEYLPYDRRWEFPRNRLQLGIQLGTGCFGRVVKAEAVGLKDSEEAVKTIAVKMVRSQANIAAMEALISELKILVYLGSHLNVVNLLGACTKQIHKGELFVIVEYCRFGNLQTFLINHRNSFVNLVDEFGNLKTQHEIESNNFTRSKAEENPSQAETSDFQAYGCSGMNSSCEILNANLNFNLEEELDGNLDRSISTTNLISWSFQIARGMDYLVSKKVLHGDLAARNILLADDGVAKVADFGMAKKMYYEDCYEKRGQGLLPVKWMAIESLTDRIFSSQSDVWSYGIVLWELFSLGRVPYPGMDVGHILMKEILNGYRMDKPELAPKFFGEMMADCWKSDPKERPTFSQMEKVICGHMESSVSSDYLNMNAIYVKLNEDKENASPKEHFGLAKLLREKSETQSKRDATRHSSFPIRFSKKR
ncbi:mast/stem cell growth factor receptor Kit-like isoform X4 [Daphnia pulicaria]|uniref:mast/stem cell growth factor receptor Kit-like isoform X4 n=1 Tax=Daphnia pulicaria TaxID=35523 RepID=UPI001EEB77CD|nr:mast/stem cell growth factor receptor Kit-like isoform X4 [Daphnia pulicaria]